MWINKKWLNNFAVFKNECVSSRYEFQYLKYLVFVKLSKNLNKEFELRLIYHFNFQIFNGNFITIVATSDVVKKKWAASGKAYAWSSYVFVLRRELKNGVLWQNGSKSQLGVWLKEQMELNEEDTELFLVWKWLLILLAVRVELLKKIKLLLDFCTRKPNIANVVVAE